MQNIDVGWYIGEKDTALPTTGMFELNMDCKIILPSKLLVTLLTRKFHTFMFRSNMSSQNTMLRSLIGTLSTCIVDTFM